jgi:3'-5' exoribonuclease
MKHQFINQCKPGDVIDDLFVLAEKSLSRKKDGNLYLNIVLSDKTGSINGVIWDDADRIVERINSGECVSVKGTINEYRGSLQLVVKTIETCSRDMFDAADFLPKTDRDIEDMFARLLEITASIKTDYLRTLVESFWRDESFSRSFKAAPAAKKMHHAYIGGLLEHVLSMATLADKIAKHYSGIDRDMLVTGAILHDIGKTKELEYDLKIDYSDQGRLLSHIVIGLKMVDEKCINIEAFPEEQLLLLKHLIVSHHGTQEFGSPEPPKTLEAVVLHYIDEIDAKVNGIRNFMAAQDPHETWTSFHRIHGRHFYKGKNSA